MELKEAVELLKEMQDNALIACRCYKTGGILYRDKKAEQKVNAIETVLNYIEILETATNNRYPYVIGGRTLYSKLQQLNKEDLIKAYLRLRNETEQHIKETENSIPKQLIEEKIKELENQYKEALEENSIKAFILKCKIEILKELLEE